MLRTIVTAGARLGSFADAAFALSLGDVTISARHVRTLTHEVGAEMAAARGAQAEAPRHRVLEPRVPTIPAAVVVEVDGGRVRTRATGCGPGVHPAEGKEDTIAGRATLTAVAGDVDPCPEPPPSFVEPRRMQRLVAQMNGQAGGARPPGPLDEAASHAPASPTTPEAEPWSPRRVVRTCVARLADRRSFGPLVAAEAPSRNVYAAGRRAFVADGAAYNGAIHRGYLPDVEPIADLLHVVGYRFGAAQAVAGEERRWPLYRAWLRAVWPGRVMQVVAAVERHQEQTGRPPPGEHVAASDPRRVVAEAVTYLRNNACRMDYPRYRRHGLPTTSRRVESLVGESNARVKGRSTFWSRPAGAEAILQVRAALLSEDGRLERFFANRTGHPFRRRAA